MRAIWVERTDAGQRVELTDVDDAAVFGDAPYGSPPDGHVDVAVDFSTLNYKDALAITGRGKVLRAFPLVPGIDLAGTVEASASPDVATGAQVVVTGYGLGEAHHGGLAERARVRAEHVVTLPPSLSTRDAMAIGTAGFTAMLCVQALERHGVTPGAGDIVVTGAAGGVGSIAVMALSRRGHRVVASSGRPELAEELGALGAAETIGRDVLAAPSRPLEKERWAGAVDAVGGQTLASVCAATRYRGVVTACGMAGGLDFPASVAPFILRGVTLVGIESVMCPMDERREAWTALAADLDHAALTAITAEIGLADAIAACDDLLAGRVRGRLVVDVTQ